MSDATRTLQLALNAGNRRARRLARQLPRTTRRLTAQRQRFAERPPVVVNSFAKSGTHLLAQVAQVLPNVIDYGTFIAMAPSIRFRPRSEAAIVRRFERVAPGELLRAHVWHRAAFSDELRRMNAVHLFIYRDPRDVVVSEAFYLAEMAPWHALSPYFRACSTLEDRISLSITGLPAGANNPCYPDIARRFADYCGWLADQFTVPVRFEDLQSDDFRDTVSRVVTRYAEQTAGGLEPDLRDKFAELAKAAVDPTRSHTFRKGAVGGWRQTFNAEHTDAMKQVAGDLLIELGYESNLDW